MKNLTIIITLTIVFTLNIVGSDLTPTSDIQVITTESKNEDNDLYLWIESIRQSQDDLSFYLSE